uniref:Protein kinase domain-containing protein n=1 Tax=Arundo donax TaxID=35708 RepID=A0A0A9A8P7_ARUDO
MVAVVAVVLVLLLSPLAAAQPWQYCGSSAMYSPNSTYQANLNAVSAALPRNASSSPALFATAAQGAGPSGRVFALTLCRGDEDAPACLGCVAGAFQHARGSCPYDKEVAVLYDACFLYFADQDFLATTANVGQISLYNTQNATSSDDPSAAVFTRQVRALLNGTARWAAYRTPRRFATARMYNGSVPAPVPTLYALTQCTPDLSPADCWGCLEELIGKAPLTGQTIGARTAGVHCGYRYENYAFYRGQPMLNMGTPPPYTEPRSGRGAGKKRKLWIVSIVVPLVTISLCVFSFGWVRRLTKGRAKLEEQPMANLPRDENVSMLWRIQDDSELTMFDFRQIVEATGNFSEERKLGQGGFGSVYKGQLPNGLEIAVKRLASHSGQGFVEFKNEVHLIAKLQHTNLVRLLGCCVQGEEHILIYEYMQNKSLDFFIFDVTRARLLTWNKRLNIIEGIAQGLLYLHKLSRLRIIHRDLKASNILLDNDMNPKISDFGLAKIFSSNAIQGNTNRVVGTYGYMAPEYASEGVFSVKTDVFSFGVLLLEIISGKRNAGFHQQGAFFNLLGYAWMLWKEGRWFELVDVPLEDRQDQMLEVLKCINIALMCVQESAADRPTMSDVVAMLSMETMSSLPHPKQPAYFNVITTDGEQISTTTPSSVNDVSVSTAEGR